MRYLLALIFIASSAHAINVNGPCPQTVGTLTLSVTQPRTSCISPCVLFFDATASTDSANIPVNGTVFQDVFFSWNFGDTLASGTGTWSNGSNPNHNSTNTATGGVAAHMYITAGRDTKYTITATATDGVNTVKCGVGGTAFDPNGSNGFPGTATVCYFNATVGSGCPSGATQTLTATVPSLAVSNKRVLFKCGDIFTTAGVTISGTKGTIGAYGSCVGTTTNRPIIRATAAPDGLLNLTNPSTDIRLTDLVIDGNNQSGITLIDNQNGGSINAGSKPVQYTFYNLDAKNHGSSYRWNAGTQMALVNSVAEAVQAGVSGCPCCTGCFINVFPNFAGTGAWSTSGTPPNEDYQFFAGNNFTNGGTGNNSFEVFRDSYASKQIISNNTMTNGGPQYSILKFHDLCFATDGGTGAWCGPATQNNLISDNSFTGSSGAQCVEMSPQNSVTDERINLTVFERNIIICTNSGFSDGREVWVSGANNTVRDNVFLPATGSTCCTGVVILQVGIEPIPQFNEVYNNTFSGGNIPSVSLGNFGGIGHAAGQNNTAKNNLGFNNGGNVVVYTTGSTGSVASNNTVNTALNPSFTNASGLLNVITDFKPTANFSGGTNVAVWYDALGVAWPPTWDLGAVHH